MLDIRIKRMKKSLDKNSSMPNNQARNPKMASVENNTMKSKGSIKKEKNLCGKFVVIESFTKKRIIAVGKKPKAVLSVAKRKGFAHPVIFYVPPRNTHTIL